MFYVIFFCMGNFLPEVVYENISDEFASITVRRVKLMQILFGT